jgi:hypothetical protein
MYGSNSQPSSRSVTPDRKQGKGEEMKVRRFLNGWSKEQERLMAEWSDIAMCYRWLHDQSEKIFHRKSLWITLPVIILSTLGGTANFGVQSLFENDENTKKYVSFGIGGIALFAGLLTTIGNYLRYAQLEESNRVASIAWGKFQRLIAVELAMNPNERMDSLDFLKICRADLDRLIEQSPAIPEEAIQHFEEKFGHIRSLKKPDICGSLEHTHVFESSELRLKQLAIDAALMLRHKKNALTELLSPKIQENIKKQVEDVVEDKLGKVTKSNKKGEKKEDIQMTDIKMSIGKLGDNFENRLLYSKYQVPIISPRDEEVKRKEVVIERNIVIERSEEKVEEEKVEEEKIEEEKVEEKEEVEIVIENGEENHG